MSAFSNYIEVEILDHILSNGVRPYDAPLDIWVGLFTDTNSPSDDGPSAEVAGGGYQRQLASFGPAAISAGVTSVKNTSILDFGTASAYWGTITYVGLYDAQTGGNCIFHGALATAKLVDTSTPFSILAGDFSVNLD